MATAVRKQQDFLAGLTVEKLLRIPRFASDPGVPGDGDFWINTTDDVVRFREGGVTYTLARGGDSLDAEQVRDIIGATLVAGNNIDITVNDAGDTVTIDVEGLTSADISDFQAAARAAITVSDTTSLDLTKSAGGDISGAVLDSPKLGGQTLTQVRDFSQTSGTRLATSATTAAAADRFLGRITPGAGTVEELTAAQAKTILALAAGDISGLAEAAQDAVGLALTDTATVDLAYDDTANTITATVLDSPTVQGANLASVRSFNLSTGQRDATSALTQATGRLLGRLTAAAGATEELTADQVTTWLALASADISDFATAVVSAVNAASNIDADTLSGSTVANIQSAVTAAIVDSAPGTLDTLNELAAALGDDPNFAATVNTAIAARSRFFSFDLTGGTTTETVTHNLNTLNTIVQIIVVATGREEEYDVVRTANTLVVTDETGGNIPTGRRVLITTAA